MSYTYTYTHIPNNTTHTTQTFPPSHMIGGQSTVMNNLKKL